MNTKRILSGILAAAMMLCLAGCGESDTPKSTESSATTSVSKPESTPDSTPDSGEVAAYQLPAGAESEYALYTTVVDYLNNGFHYDDLKELYDPNLTAVFYSKWRKTPEEIFTLGMDYDEACALLSRLRDKASKMDPPLDEDGDFDEDLIDYDAFQSEFPESIQSQINENHDSFEDFIKMSLYDWKYDFNYYNHDGEQPFGTDQTKWEEISRDELDIIEFDGHEWDKDLSSNFPPVYVMDLGVYRKGNSIDDMWLYFTKIDNRYYLINFQVMYGNAGG